MLTKEDFDSFLATEREKLRPCLIMFHVNWCKVCQRTFPKFVNASEQVLERQIGMDFAHVDCTNDKTLCQRYGVKGYPTIKLFPPKADAEPLQFRSQRSEVGFVRYAERMTQPPVRQLTTAAELAEVLANETFAAFVATAGSSQEIPRALTEAAERWRDRHLFALTPKLKDVLPEGVVVPAGATMAVLSAGAQQWPGRDNTSTPQPAALFFRGDLDNETAVRDFIEGSRFPGIWSLDETNFYEFTHSSRRVAMVALDQSRVSAVEERILRGASARLGDSFLFGVLDGQSWAEELADFNIAQRDLPRVLVAEEDFEVWIEDVDELRLANLEGDLRGLLSGEKPLLRQGRNAWSKFQFYAREAKRNALRLHAYSQRGTMEATIAAGGVIAGLLAVMVLGWCASACCRVLLAEDDVDYSMPPPRTSGQGKAVHTKRD